MKKFLKIFFGTIGVIVILLIIIPIIFKKPILKKVQTLINENVNATVKFADFNLSLFKGFPDLSVELTDLSVVGINQFAGDTLVAFKSFYAEVNLLSAISGSQIKVKAIVLDHPTLNGKVLADGKANWDIAKPAEEKQAENKDEASGETKFNLSLKKFKIINANIIFDDRKSNLFSEIKNLNYNLKGDFSQDKTDLNNNLEIEELTLVMQKITYLNKVVLSLKAEVGADLKVMRFIFNENVFKINELTLGFDGFVELKENKDVDLDVKFDLKKSEFKDILSLVPAVFTKEFAGLKTSGKIALNGFGKGVYNEKNLPAFGLNLMIENAMFQYPDLPKAVENVNIKVAVENKGGSADNTVVDVSKFHIEIAKNPIDVSLNIKTPVSDPLITGSFKGKIVLESLKDVLKLDNANLKGLIDMDLAIGGQLSSIEKQEFEKFKADGKLGVYKVEYKSKDFKQGAVINEMLLLFSPQYVDLQNFDAKVGKSDFNLKGKIDNLLSYLFKKETLRANFDFTSNLIDVNEFMGGESKPAQEEATADGSPMSVVEIPNNIDFKLTSKLNKILYDKLEISNTVGLITLKDSRAALENLSMQLLDGTMNINGSYTSKDLTKPTLDFGLDIKQFDIHKTYTSFSFLKGIVPLAESCKGKISTQLNITNILDQQMSPILNTMNGGGKLQSQNIEVSGSKTLDKLSAALKSDKYKKLELSNIAINFIIKDGNIEFDPFDVQLGKGKATISGKQNIDQTMNHKIAMAVPRSEFGGAANDVLNNLAKNANVPLSENINLNVLIGGTVTDPDVKLDMSETKNTVTDIVNNEIDKQKEKAREQARKLIEDADKQGQKLIAEAEKKAADIKKAASDAAAKVKSEADEKGKKLIKEAGSNPIKKEATKQTAKELNKQAEKQAQNIISEGDKNAAKLVDEAKKQAKKLKDDAQKKADAMLQ